VVGAGNPGYARVVFLNLTLMRLLGKLIGLALVLSGIYFLGQNIIFTTQTSAYWWRDISAAGSVISLLAGVLMLLNGREMKQMGWILIGLGIVLVFVSGGVILRPTSLWTLFLALVLLVGGYNLITTGRIDL
jgi:hypothetical protein